MKLINNTPYLLFFNPHISIFFKKNTKKNTENTEKNHKKYKKTIKMRFLESEFLAKKSLVMPSNGRHCQGWRD